MGWTVFNVSKRQRFFIGKMREKVFALSLDQYFSPACYLPSDAGRPRQSDSSRNEGRPDYHPQTQSAFMQLPIELIHAVSFRLHDFEDVVCLALTCRLSWDIALYTMTRFQDVGGSWSGDRIICVADYAFEFPDGLLNDAERAIIATYPPDRRSPYYALIELCSNQVAHSVTEKFFDTLRDIGQDDYDVWVNRVPNPRRRDISDGLALRNLVTREYIRGDAFKERLMTAPADSYIHEWSLVDVLILRICCPAGGVATMDYNKFSDAWAGHRFDVVKEEEIAPSEWRDVSSDVLDEVWELFRYDGDL